MTQDMVSVEPIDRENAWPFRPSCYKDTPDTRMCWDEGVYDHAAPCIKAFARHRLKAIEATGVVELREALERIATMRPAGDLATATGTRALVQRMEAAAIQALTKLAKGSE